MVLAAREEESASEAVAEGWVFAGWRALVVGTGGRVKRGFLLTEGIGHAEGVTVCFDKVAAFDVGLEAEVGDQGAGLRGFAVE